MTISGIAGREKPNRPPVLKFHENMAQPPLPEDGYAGHAKIILTVQS